MERSFPLHGVFDNSVLKEDMYRSILVTGGCGFIGSNLIPRLLELGVKVRVFDNFSRPAVVGFVSPDVDIVRGDIRNFDDLQSAVEGVDAVVHLAAFGSVVESIDEPSENFDINARGTFNVLRASQLAGISRVIFASTGGALIGDAVPPVSELSLPKPISPYGASKLCGEAYCHAFAKAYGLHTVALRFANVYGPNSAHKRGATTTFIKALISEQPMVIYGDGMASRDYLHVDDLCLGIVLALKSQLQPGVVLHLASGIETTVGTLASTLANIAGKNEHPVVYKESRQGEVLRNFANADLANQLLGFRPKHSLRSGLENTWQWFLKQDAQVVLQAKTTES